MAVPVSGRSKNRSAIHQGIGQLEQALKSGDLATAQSIATAIYEQDTAAPSIESSSSDIIIDPALGVETSGHLREKAACQIAECFYKHAELELAKQWAQTTTASGTLSNQYVRRAHVLLGDIAMAMDRDDEAVAWYRSVIELKNQYREQPAAYAGLLELLMLQKQDDLVEQWVRHGQNKFEGAGGLELDFLREASRVLKRRNHPLWREINEQIVALDPKKGKLQALRELASNARKFGRWAEAEQHYAAICALPLNSAEETVNAHLFLAEVQAKQNKDITPTLQSLQQKTADFADATDKEYATYRLAKFYETQGQLENASTLYASLCNGSSTSTWAAAALHQLAALKEKQGDLQRALQLYLQYPQRFPQNERLAIQSLASALNVAETLGDTNATEQIASAISAKAATVQDYNVHLNLAYHYRFKKRQTDLAISFLESGIVLAAQAVTASVDSSKRVEIHFRVLRKLVEFGQLDRALTYFATYSSDLPASISAASDAGKSCLLYKALALYGRGRRADATQLLQGFLMESAGDPRIDAVFGQLLGLFQLETSGVEAAKPMLEAMAEQYPRHPWTNLGRLELAVSRFNGGDVAGALKLAEAIVAASSGSDKNMVVRETYWSAVYVRGRCLLALGERQQGQAQMQEATAHMPKMRVSQRLR